jgi:hypothetical protein
MVIISEWSDSWPEWPDTGHQVEILPGDGRIIKGELITSDVGSDGEGEYPIFSVVETVGPSSVVHSFADAVHWRFHE